MGRPKMTEEEKAAKAAAKVEEPKAEKVTAEVATVEVSYKMKVNVLHDGVQYKAGEVAPAELVEDFMEKGFVDKELKEI